MARGDLIVARAYGGRALIRRVWEVTDRAVYIHSEERYQQRKAGLRTSAPVGIPREDAFVYDATTFSADAEGRYQNATFWAALRQYEGEPTQFSIGDRVRMLDNADFAGYEGIVVRLTHTRRNTRGYIHVQFPGHPWQGAGDDFGLDPWELEKV